MTSKEITLVLNYLKNRQSNNDFSKGLLAKLESCKSDSEKNYWITKAINPAILKKIIKGELS